MPKLNKTAMKKNGIRRSDEVFNFKEQLKLELNKADKAEKIPETIKGDIKDQSVGDQAGQGA